MNTIFGLAVIGGVVSLLSTSLGAALTTFFTSSNSKVKKLSISMDFTLGVMLSAVAFSLVGPELVASFNEQSKLRLVLASFFVGILFIGLLNKFVNFKMDHNKGQSKVFNSSKIVLALALILHNLPEGMGAGASLAAMDFAKALPIQVVIAVQNIVEGLVLALCFISFGLSTKKAIAFSIGSGLVELLGAIIAGIALNFSLMWLPALLSVAGGAMLMSVLIEFQEGIKEYRTFSKYQFLSGILIVPAINMFF
ncbi:ZIP family metal transporter [Bacteriovorax sp. BSW11_IV]|uniref:ZIP family metal transporter n=1 Tax=Bacteriovorax sp. BSW11_IV TaxID=1353529 RepID=UPI00040BD178|nr:ZIP family metal transporter [Bacteriovorax sp. BSW11_IV]